MDRHFVQRTEEANTTWKVIHANASQRAQFRPELLVVSTSHPPLAAPVFAARVMQAPMRRLGKGKDAENLLRRRKPKVAPREVEDVCLANCNFAKAVYPKNLVAFDF